MLLRSALALLLGLVPAAVPGTLRAQDETYTLIAPQTNATRVDPPTGFPVTGRMVCADTQRAARFAQVSLLPVANNDRNGFGRRMSARTDLDGNFVVTNVPPGDYYVTGFLIGYVNQAQLVERTLSAAATDPNAASALTGIPVVHVSAGGASTALSLQRGAVVAGTVQWDDGTPAAGVSVSAQPAPTDGASGLGAGQLSAGPRGLNQPFAAFAGAQTDDRGRFRLTGLAPGSYFVHANIIAPAPPRADDRGFARTLVLAVYAPDKLRRTDATPIALTAGEERPDLNLTLGLAGMHTVSGTVASSSTAVHSGNVILSDGTDSSLTRNGVINPDGSFTVPYVPAGTYTLRVNASSQQPSYGRPNGATPDPGIRFQPLQESLTVTDGDLSGLTVNVTPATTATIQ